MLFYSSMSNYTSAIPLCLGAPEEFASCKALLEGAGYTVAAMCDRLGIEHTWQFKSIRQGRTAALEIECSLDVLVRLFMDGEYVNASRIRSLLGDSAIGELSALGLIGQADHDPDLYFGTVVVYPMGPLYLASDRATSPDASPFHLPQDVVYPALVENTRFFLSTLPASPCDSFLDIGTGTGVAALLGAAQYARQAFGTDITERAVRFAEFNRLLNGLNNVTIARGDLYEPAGDRTFDRIVAHPPYVPVPKPTYVYRDGGPDGEQIIRRVVEGLPRHLRPCGTFHAVTLGSDRKGEPFEQRIRKWLGEKAAEFDIVLCATSSVKPLQFAVHSVQRGIASAAELEHWKAMFEKLEVEQLFYGSILIARKTAGRNPITLRVQNGDASGYAEVEWLLRWARAGSEAGIPQYLLESRPKLSPCTEMTVLHRAGEGGLVPAEYTFTSEYPFRTECRCAEWVAALLARCDGTLTAREHFENMKAGGTLNPKMQAQEFIHVLGNMVLAGFVQIEGYLPPGKFVK
ncbi:MAG: class I SAM-dependent methyltransferase [Acidobacteria bacterium]|nr:class I SAM-dependent methyltransferase [Acidobacteriota bacterium]